jgi:hypothetical protein
MCVSVSAKDAEIRWENKSKRGDKVCICVYKICVCVCVLWSKTPRSGGETNRGGGEKVCAYACIKCICVCVCFGGRRRDQMAKQIEEEEILYASLHVRICCVCT